MPRVLVVLMAALFCLGPVPLAAGQNQKSPYAGQQERVVKALSVREINDYEQGRGMGLAKAAELNHYPGPKHVLELAERLGLSQEQRSQTNQIFHDMRVRAVALGALILQKERRLDDLFASGRIDGAKLKTLTMDIATLRGELREVHLLAHLKMKRVLSQEQVAAYDGLRGYLGKAGGAHQGSGSKHPGQHRYPTERPFCHVAILRHAPGQQGLGGETCGAALR